jgi:hypothetical protein
MSLRHRFQSAVPTGSNAALIRPSDWNDTHVLSGGTAGQVLQRDTGAADGWSWTDRPDPDGPSGLTLLNATGVALSAGDVVALDPTTDTAVRLGDTEGSLEVFVVAAESIAPSVTGRFYRHGAVTVKVQGAVTRGRYLVKSATSRAMGDSGVAMGPTASAPPGACAVAMTAAAGPDLGTVTAYLLADVARQGATRVRLTAIRAFTASGTWTKPTGLHHVVVSVTGGGGGGGGVVSNRKGGGGGGAGATAILRIEAASLGATEAVTVGAGGAGVAGGNGLAGGTSSFGAFVSAAGGGGTSAGAETTDRPGDGAALPSTGDLRLGGGGGTAGGDLVAVTTAAAGTGGASFWGQGGRGSAASGNGDAAVAPGAGGGGARNNTGGSQNYAGGNGADGLVVVWEYET